MINQAGANYLISKEHRSEFKAAFPNSMAIAYPAYHRILKQKGYRDANLSLLTMSKRLRKHGLNLSWDDDDIKTWCEAKSSAMNSAIKTAVDEEMSLSRCKAELDKFDIDMPEPQIDSIYEPVFARLSCPKWWRRQVRKLQARELDQLSRDLKIVNRKDQIYISNEVLNRKRQQNTRNRKLLEAMVAENGEGQQYTLAELSDLSTSKPSNRRNELMVRLDGFQQYADKKGHVAMFYTVTCPSRFHVFSGFQENKKYKGEGVRSAQKYLSGVWSRVRAKFGRDGVRCYGFRVAEPHHDGCPHWHYLLWFESEQQAGKATAILRYYALQDSGDELGAKKYRFDKEKIDRSKGSAVAYIAKYISKNIDGYGVDADLYGHDAKQSAERICAWASCYGIRQFQQIGGASVTVWRELRRIRYGNGGERLGGLVEAAQANDWALYTELMGGGFVGREDQPVRAAYWLEYDPETGEDMSKPFTEYGDISKGKLFGVRCDGVHHLTREYVWEVKRWDSESKESSEQDDYLHQQYMGKVRVHDDIRRFKFWGFGGQSPTLEFYQ